MAYPSSPLCLSLFPYSISLNPYLLVSRIVAKSENYEMDLTLDIHSEMYPMEVHEKFALVLSPTLRTDGSLGSQGKIGEEVSYNEFAASKHSLADKFEYVMYGKIFKYENQGSSKMQVISFTRKFFKYLLICLFVVLFMPLMVAC